MSNFFASVADSWGTKVKFSFQAYLWFLTLLAALALLTPDHYGLYLVPQFLVTLSILHSYRTLPLRNTAQLSLWGARGSFDRNPRQPIRTWPDLRGAGSAYSFYRSAPITRVLSARRCADTLSCFSAHATSVSVVGCSAIYSACCWSGRIV